MTTKDFCSPYHDYSVAETFDNQLKNLNLNQNHKCFSVDTIQSKSITKTDNKKSLNNDFIDFCAKKNQNLWNYGGNKKFPSNFLSVQNICDKEELKEGKHSSANSSTLSLHIAAYENSIENSSNEFCENSKIKNEKLSLVKRWETAKQSMIQNPFEFPRQQESQNIEPEIMQFKASQRLLSPNFSEKRMITDSIRYAAEYIAYFFYSDPFVSGEEIEKFTIELANSILKTIYQNEGCRKKLNQHTLINSQRECCQGSDEFVMELNVDGRLASMIGDIAQSVMTLTPQEIADLLPDNTYVVVSECYAFYSINHGPCVFIYKTNGCKFNETAFRLKRNPIIRYNNASQCFEINRKWPKNNGFSKTSELIPRIQVVASLASRQRNGRKKNGHFSILTPPKSAPPFLSHSSSFANAFDNEENQEIGQKFLQMVKARLI